MNINIPGLNIGVKLHLGLYNQDDTISLIPGYENIDAVVTDVGLAALNNSYICEMSETCILGDGISNYKPKRFIGAQTTNIVKGASFTTDDINKYVLYPDGTTSKIIKFIDTATLIVRHVKNIPISKMATIDINRTGITNGLSIGLSQAISDTVVANPNYISEVRNYNATTGTFSIAQTRYLKFTNFDVSHTIREIGIGVLNESITPECFAYADIEDLVLSNMYRLCVGITITRSISCKQYSTDLTYIPIISGKSSIKINMENDMFDNTYYSHINPSTGETVSPAITGTLLERKSSGLEALATLANNTYIPTVGSLFDNTISIIDNTYRDAIAMEYKYGYLYVLTPNSLFVYKDINTTPTYSVIDTDMSFTKMFIVNQHVCILYTATGEYRSYLYQNNTLSLITTTDITTIINSCGDMVHNVGTWNHDNSSIVHTGIDNTVAIINYATDSMYSLIITNTGEITYGSHVNNIGNVSGKLPTCVCTDANNKVAIGCNNGMVYLYTRMFDEYPYVNTINLRTLLPIEHMYFIANDMLVILQDNKLYLFDVSSSIELTDILEVTDDYETDSSSNIPLKLWDGVVCYQKHSKLLGVYNNSFATDISGLFACKARADYIEQITFNTSGVGTYDSDTLVWLTEDNIIKKMYYYPAIAVGTEDFADQYHNVNYSFNNCTFNVGINQDLKLSALSVAPAIDESDNRVMYHIVFDNPIEIYGRSLVDFKFFKRYGKLV